MAFLLELNDSEMPLYRDNQLVHKSPAIAIVSEQRMVFGDAAFRLARSHPQETNHQYFSRLNADPLPKPVSKAGNHADLVYLHMCELKSLIEGEVILAVPGFWNADQLGVLLGIMQEAGIEVGGFVDSAVVVATTRSLPPEAHYVDIHLQSACVTAMTVNNEVSRVSTEEVTTCGFVSLLDGWVNIIADRFVQDTRFDPLHSATTEQQLYNQVYDWVNGDIGNEINVEIVHEDHTRRVEVSTSLLANKAQQRFRSLGDALPPGAHVLLSSRSANLPGLQQGLLAEGYTISVASDNALVDGCVEHMERIHSPLAELKLVTRLPHSLEPKATKPIVRAPTHVLVGDSAAPIMNNGYPLTFHHKQTQVLLSAQEGVLINGNSITDEVALAVGDEIVQGERSYRMIFVEG